VVKAFNTVGAEVMADPCYPDGPAVLPVAGDGPRAKATALALTRDLGCEPVDAGPLAMARHLEPFRHALDQAGPGSGSRPLLRLPPPTGTVRQEARAVPGTLAASQGVPPS
jgi:predicted dinucleotide-binding enzyme